MLISCPNCPKVYRLAEDAIPPMGRDVRCASCEAVWWQSPEQEELPTPLSTDDEFDVPFIDAVGVPVLIPDAMPRVAIAAPDADRPSKETATPPSQSMALPSVDTAPFDEEPNFGDPPREGVLMSAARALSVWEDRFISMVQRLLCWLGVRPKTAPTPGDLAAAEFRRAARRKAINRLTPSRALGWFAWTVTASACLTYIVARPEFVKSIFPASENLYAVFSPVQADPLYFTSVQSRLATSTNGPVLEVSGSVENRGDESLQPVIAVLTGEDRSVATLEGEVRHISTVPLPPGGERPFVLRAQIPDATREARLVVLAGDTAKPANNGYTLQKLGSGWGQDLPDGLVQDR